MRVAERVAEQAAGFLEASWKAGFRDLGHVEQDPDFDWSKVVVMTAADIPGANVVSIIIEDMPAPDAETRINWGHVGSLTETNEQLSQLLRFAIGS